ncbi:dihydrofolate reductase [Coprinopsis sp. MPI-PUGE-AT-0042]|nr:dihydrofolate reductase [Coprinopsis sp. MPI-PUGE-AT-0042]
MSRLTIIVAATKSNGIGQKANLPWKLAKEMKYFAQVTSRAPEGKKNAVIMGRNTWESIPAKFRPLPNRLNVVVSRNTEYQLNAPEQDASKLAPSLAIGFRDLEAPDVSSSINRVFVIGGATLYHETLALPVSDATPYVDRILITRILEPEFECDVFMPEFNQDEKSWTQSSHAELQAWVGIDVPEGVQEEKGVKYEFQMWMRV